MSNLAVRENTVKSIVKSRLAQLKTLVPDKSTQSRYASAITAIAMQKHLLNVEPESIVKTAFEIVQAGLNPNPLFGQAYVVPFKGVAQLQIGYKGWIVLSHRAGWTVRAVAVYDVDKFSIKFAGLKDIIDFEPDLENREEDDGAWVYKHLKGVIVYAEHKSGLTYSEFVPFRKLEKLRVKSQNQKAGSLQHIWLEWAEEMYKAKALKYVITRLPIDDATLIEASAKEDEPLRNEDVIDTEIQQPQPQTLNTQVLPPKKEIGNLEKHYPDLINAGVKRNDLKDFIERYQLTDENIESTLSDVDGLKVMVEEFYNKEALPI